MAVNSATGSSYGDGAMKMAVMVFEGRDHQKSEDVLKKRDMNPEKDQQDRQEEHSLATLFFFLFTYLPFYIFMHSVILL